MNISQLVPISSMDRGDQADEYSIGNLAVSAEAFLCSQTWCKSIRKGYLGLGKEGIVGVFLFEFEPTREGVDDKLWIIVGDLPPAYLVCDCSPDAPSALKNYIYEMRKWVNVVSKGAIVHGDIIPVNAPPTREYARMLRSRLDFLENKILPPYTNTTSQVG